MPRKVACVLSALLCLALLCSGPLLADTTVRFLGVGQGDAILIHSDPDTDVLIDGGPRGAMDDYLEDMPPLDAVLWTHAHADHIGGLETKPKSGARWTLRVYSSTVCYEEDDYARQAIFAARLV